MVDDDQDLLHVLVQAFQDRYTVVTAADALGALHQIHAERPSLVLLDLTLPDLDGVLLVGKIRELSPVPIIVLSGRHGQADRVMSLRIGADDFITKPFDLDDLDSRIETVLRRTRREHTPQNHEYGGLRVSAASGASYRTESLHLTPTELKLLAVLVENGGKLVTYEQLSGIAFGKDTMDAYHSLQVYVARLRRLLLTLDRAPVITTVTHAGYRMVLDGSHSNQS